MHEADRLRRLGVPQRVEPTACPQGHPYPESLRYVNGKKKSCKVCHAESQARRYHSDPERHQAAARAWREANGPRTDYFREWREKNRDKHRGYMRRAQHLRRIGKNTELFEWTEQLRGEPCVYCGGSSGSIDHIHPVIAGGGNEYDNLAPACVRCNQEKRSKQLLTFLLERAS